MPDVKNKAFHLAPSPLKQNKANIKYLNLPGLRSNTYVFRFKI